jgi:hypothetical protein
MIHTVRLWSLGVLLPFAAGSGCSADAPARTTLVTTPPERSWTACTTHDSCEARWLPCRGWLAVNRSHAGDVEAWYSRTNYAYLSRADCDGRPRRPPVAFCRAQQCTLE